MIVGAGLYELQGSPEQIAIISPVFEPASPSFIRFPWGRLSPPTKPIPIGWMDLNAAHVAALHYVPTYGGPPEKIPGHVHVTDEDGNEGHSITRMIDGRLWIAGVFWTDGRIYVDNRCVAEPDLAREVVAAELAHSVDYFLPLSDEAKTKLMMLWHEGGEDTHTWWEIHDYGSEYFTLGGEAFMAAWTIAYSDLVPDQSSFTHRLDPDDGPLVRAILDVEEVAAVDRVVRIGSRPKYHRPLCYFVRIARTLGRPTTNFELVSARMIGLVACRVCKPG